MVPIRGAPMDVQTTITITGLLKPDDFQASSEVTRSDRQRQKARVIIRQGRFGIRQHQIQCQTGAGWDTMHLCKDQVKANVQV